MDRIIQDGEKLGPKDHAERVAMFRVQVIGPLLARDFQDHGELADEIRAIAAKYHRPPESSLGRQYSAPTIERWYYEYRHGGLDALRPRRRSDAGHARELTEAQREKFFAFITGCGEIEFGIAGVDAAVIDEINILQATHRAMNDALAKLNPPPQHALVDGRPVKTMRVPQTAIVKGDARSYSIAAASVLAKVTRDRLMLEAHAQWPEYAFAEHKGYGTAKHLAAIEKHGA